MVKKLAKLTPPHFTAIYPRVRLFKKIDHWGNAPAIWVSAPAGSGKTTLVASYLQDRGRSVYWYQLDEGDAELANFFYYLGLLVKHHATELPALTSEYRASGIPAFARRFFRRLYSLLPQHAVLVLDNYQDAHCELFAEIISLAIEEIPPELQLVLISREPSPQVLARLLATQQLHVLDKDDICLTREETEGICALTLPQVSADLVDDLYKQTQGWAAGVVLLIEQEKQGEPKISTNVKTRIQQTLFNYFAAEVLQHTTPALQEILLKTAFLPHITVEMAVTLTGNTQAGALLDDLASRNYFTYRHENEHRHFEYHPLFADFLKQQLGRLYDAETLVRLRSRSAQLLADSGRYEHAIKLFNEVKDWQAAIQIILEQAPLLLEQGRDQIVRQWLESLPAEMLLEQARLSYWLGASVLAADPNAGLPHFERAYQRFRQQRDWQGSLQSWIGAVDCIILSLSQLARLDQWLERLGQLQLQNKPDEDSDLDGQVASRVMAIITLRQPDHPQRDDWYNKAECAVQQIEDPNQRIIIGNYLVIDNIWRGDLTTASEFLERLARDDPTGLPPLAASTYLFGRAWLAWSAGDFDGCQLNLDMGLALIEESGVYVWYAVLLMMGANIAIMHGDIAKAETYLQRLTPEIIEARDMDRSFFYLEQAAFKLAAGDLLQALECQQRALKATEEFGAIYTRADACFGMAQLLQALGEQEQAEQYLLQAVELGRRYDSWTMAMQCAILQALFDLDGGEESRAIAGLQFIFEQVHLKGFVTFHSWQPQMMARLFAFCLRNKIYTDVVVNLIRRFHLSAPQSDPLPDWPWALKINSFGGLHIEKQGEPLRFSGKAQKKTLELLMAIITCGGSNVSAAHLTEILWPDADGDAAYQALTSAVYRLRKLIGHDSVDFQEGRLSLNPQQVWLDCWALEHQLAGELLDRLAPAALQHRLSQVLLIYQGALLAGEEAYWVLEPRERWRTRVLHVLAKGVARLREAGQGETAIHLCASALEIDPLAEVFYQEQMAAYLALGQAAEAMKVYEHCYKALHAGLGVTPSPRTESLRRGLVKQP